MSEQTKQEPEQKFEDQTITRDRMVDVDNVPHYETDGWVKAESGHYRSLVKMTKTITVKVPIVNTESPTTEVKPTEETNEKEQTQ